MLTLRGILFTIFVPGMVGGYIPYLFHIVETLISRLLH